ncbi:MAG TPA: serine/threonine-protein kinase, partial [Gemmatimonadaceae bacterium]|nr:serine/threonine-protein kinase [Gemmatimonadaceae bacterium]
PTDGSTLRSASGSGDDIIGSVIADRYHVIRKLGEGGMGQVYLAEHVKMGRMSAIKVMTPALVHDTDAVGRFNREAANASRINHPNIAAIYDFGETSDGLIYLAMEFVEGESLTRMCEALGALDAPRAAEIARQVSSALEAAHERGIVHRDLKPDNIMISRGRDGGPLVKVVDFGIAKAAEGANQKVTRTGLVVGTPEYMSPEQLTGDTLDGRSDLYALALVTFNMLTGMLPFTGQTTQEALLKRLTDRPLTLAEARPDLYWPPELQSVLDRALSRLAQDRYQHASEFGAAIVAAVSDRHAGELLHAATQVIPGGTTGARTGSVATPTPTASPSPTPTAAPASAPVTAAPALPVAAALLPAPRSARDRFLVPALLAAALVVVVGGAMFMRSRAARTTSVASTQTVDSAASGLGTPSAPASSSSSSAPLAASDSSDDSSDSAEVRGSAADSVSASAPAPAPPAPPVIPTPGAGAGSDLATRIRDRRAEKDAARKSKPPVISTAPPSAPPVAPSIPPVRPPAATPSAPTNAEQARAAVSAAGTMVDDDKPTEAMTAVRGALPLLTTRDDSVTALYYLAHAMIQRSDKTGDDASHARACSILTLIGKAAAHPKATEIRSLSSQECK